MLSRREIFFPFSVVKPVSAISPSYEKYGLVRNNNKLNQRQTAIEEITMFKCVYIKSRGKDANRLFLSVLLFTVTSIQISLKDVGIRTGNCQN